MKKLLFLLIAFSISGVSFAQTKASDIAKFTAETVDLGKIEQSVPATATFTVKNIGKSPLIIESASPSCGCTVSDFTKEPIMPGKTGVITAKYDAAGLNAFEKHVNVKFAGVDEIKSITFKGEVLSKADFTKQ